MMPGGDREAWDRVAPMLTKMAAQVDGVPCCAYIGPQGAGHYVKMVHNGIEYADMQLIAEAYDLMKSVYGLDAPAMAEIFQTWKQGDLDSYLIEIAAAVLRKTDGGTGKPLVDVIVDEAEQKGTGRWTAQSALELGVPLTAITEAVYARSPLGAARDAARDGQEDAASGACDAQARNGGDRRRPRRALRLEDHRLRARVRADVGRLGAVRLGPQARRAGDHLARRMHHPRPFPRSHQGSLRPKSEARQPVARRLFPARRRADGRRVAARGCAGGRQWRADSGVLFCRSPITTGSDAPGARPTCCRACATISAPTPIAASTGKAVSIPAGARTGARSRSKRGGDAADLEGAASRTFY